MGETVGVPVGVPVGETVGIPVGALVGVPVGVPVGALVGTPVVGETLGLPLATVGVSVVGL